MFLPVCTSQASRHRRTDTHFAALVFYEYAITLSQEIKTIWQGPFNFSAALFVSNRYVLVFNAVLSLVIDLTWGNSVRATPELSLGSAILTGP